MWWVGEPARVRLTPLLRNSLVLVLRKRPNYNHNICWDHSGPNLNTESRRSLHRQERVIESILVCFAQAIALYSNVFKVNVLNSIDTDNRGPLSVHCSDGGLEFCLTKLSMHFCRWTLSPQKTAIFLDGFRLDESLPLFVWQKHWINVLSWVKNSRWVWLDLVLLLPAQITHE